ncbi:MAG: rhodanese-like domain-containing protein [Proteocatella sp.]
MKKLALLFLIFPMMLMGCGSNDIPNTDTADTPQYIKITPEEAKNIMDTESGVIILDVRTQEEFDSGHIKDAVLIPNTQITDSAPELLPDKNQKILVYCRSGNRSKSASDKLVSMGYTKVYDFGGIIDWPY